MRLLALAATALCFYLLGASLAESHVAGCGAGSSCDAVLSSRWSAWLGLPVAAPAAAIYGLAFIATLHIGPGASLRRQGRAWSFLLPAAIVIVLAAIWFFILQAAVIRAFCPWCMATHTCGLLLGVLLLAMAPVRHYGLLPPWRLGWLGAVGGGAVAMLIVGQLLYAPASHQVIEHNGPGNGASHASNYQFATPGGVITLQAGTLPTLGDPAAPHVVALMADHTCPHCRAMHDFIRQARQRYGQQLAIVIIPAPLDRKCNPAITETEPANMGACDYAELSLAVWRAEPAKYEEFDHYLFEPQRPPSVAEARAKAQAMVGQAALDKALASGWPREQISRNVKLYGFAKVPRLPCLLGPRASIQGVPPKVEEFFKDLEKVAGLEGK